MSRLSRRAASELSAEERELYDQIAKRRAVDDGHVGGPFDVWLTSPEMGRRIMGLGNLFRFRTEVDRRQVEIAILITGARWRAQYEWYSHEPMARDAGVPEAVIHGIKDGTEPEFESTKDRAAYRLITELHAAHRVSDATYAEAVAEFGERGVAELINVAGYYVMVSMSLNTFEVDLPEGAEPPFA